MKNFIPRNFVAIQYLFAHGECGWLEVGGRRGGGRGVKRLQGLPTQILITAVENVSAAARWVGRLEYEIAPVSTIES